MTRIDISQYITNREIFGNSIFFQMVHKDKFISSKSGKKYLQQYDCDKRY